MPPERAFVSQVAGRRIAAVVAATQIMLTAIPVRCAVGADRRPAGDCHLTGSLSALMRPKNPVDDEYDRLGKEGNSDVYNLDYAGARGKFQGMVQIAPDRPAGYVYLANDLWLETLNRRRRLSTTLYSGDSFYVQDQESDKTEPARDAQFAGFINKAISVSSAMLVRDPVSVEALYYKGAALGLDATYAATVGRSFKRAISGANKSIQLQRRVVQIDPLYYDAYLSIGLYEYVIDSLPFGWRVLARLAGLKGSKQHGIRELESVAEHGKFASDDARVVLIGIYEREMKLQRAYELIDYLAKKYDANYLLGVERARMLYRLGRPEEGSRGFESLLKNQAIAATATDLIDQQWGEALAGTGDFGAALDRFNGVIGWSGSEADLLVLARLHAGECLDALGRRTEALTRYQEVLKRQNVFDSRQRAARYTKSPYSPEAEKRGGAAPTIEQETT